MTATWTDVRLRCACGREWSHSCDQNWAGRRWTVGEAATWSTDNPEPFVVRAIIGLPARLKAHRAAHDLSQREVARRSGVSFSTISRIESGHDYSVESLIALAAYLDGAA